MSGYIGNIPTPQATQSRQTFTATAGQTTFATVGYTAGFIDVYLNGVHLLDGTDYTATNGSDIVLTVGAALDDVIEFVAYETFSVLDQSFTGATTTQALTTTGAFTSLGIDDNATSTAMTLDATGNVGIGTTNPSAALDVVGDIEVSGSLTLGDEVLGKVALYSSNQNAPYMIAATPSYTGATTNWGTYGFQHRLKSDAGGVARITVDTRLGEVYSISDLGDVTISGDIEVGGGIVFGAGGPAPITSNTLDDYEEGTWTVQVYDAASGGNASSTTTTGYYVKVGGLVVASFDALNNISTSGLTPSYSIYVTLPFAASATGRSNGSVQLDNVTFPASCTMVNPQVSDNASRSALSGSGSGAADVQVKAQDFNGTTSDIVNWTLSYRTS